MDVEAPGRVAESGAVPSSSRIALWILIALTVLSPWAFGATPPWAVRIATVTGLAVALVVSVDESRRGSVCLPRAPLWPLAIVVALGFTQLLPLPAWVHGLLAPGSAAVWHPSEPTAAAVLTDRARPISIEPAATSSWLGLTTGLIGLALLAAPALGRRRTLIAAAWVLVGSGALVAVYGIVARVVFGPLLYGHYAVPTVSPMGPFVNKNHFGGYVLMPGLLALGLGRGLWRQAAADPEKPRASPRALVAFAAAAIMILAVLSSLSRGAALGIVCGMTVFAVVEIMTARRPGSLPRVVVPATLVLLLVVVVAFLPSDARERLSLTRWQGDRSASFRIEIWRDSFRAWMASPIVGQGLGAFADVLPRFKTTAGAFRVEHPENEILEMAVEGGLVGLAAVATIVVGGLVFSVRAIRGHRDRVVRGVVNGAVAGVAGLTAHGLVDFNLRIPSNALMFVTLMTLAIAPLGFVAWRATRGWAFVAAVAALAATYGLQSRERPGLGPAHASAVKSQATQRQDGRLARLWMADRGVREYLGHRPADAEAWLLAAWTAGARGNRADGGALARHAVTLDPQSRAVQEAMRALAISFPEVETRP
jgi:O-antigen ligase